jgi:hypothetical protein
MDNGHRHADDDRLEERSTTELVEELVEHGKRLVQVEVRVLREQLAAQMTHARGELQGESRALVTEARARLADNLAAVRRDVKEQVDRAAGAAKPMAAGGVIAHAALYVLLAALVLGLGTLMPLWVAALIVGVATAIAGGAALAAGKKKLELVGKDPLPRTQQQLTENKRWIDTTKETVATKLREVKSALSDVEWPRLPGSSGAERGRTTSASRLEASSSARRPI